MKKFAIKGLITLAVVVALCMFFSGTIKTISTAKVKLVTAKQGKLEETLKLSATLCFPETQEIKLTLSDEESVVITRVRVTKGRSVKAGDTLFEAEVVNGDSTLSTLTQTIEDAQTELIELVRKNGELRLKRTEELWVAAYDALVAAKKAYVQAQTALSVAATLAGVTLEAGCLPADVTDASLLACQAALDEAERAQSDAQSQFNSANRLGISEDVITYITKQRELENKIEDAQQKITALTVLQETVAVVTAPYDGYVVEVNVKAGDTLDSRTAAIVMSAEGSNGVLRADVSDIERTIDKGTQVTFTNDSGKSTTKNVTASGVDETGKRYVEAEVSAKDITTLGGAASLLETAVQAQVSYRASSSTTLLPVSAVRGTGDSRYVYLVNESQNALGQTTLTIAKQDVTVLAEVGSTASIEQDLARQRVAYMEDRAISEGSEVMVYGN